MAKYITDLEKIVGPKDIYLAGSLGQLSFLTTRYCLNINDEYHMEIWVSKMMTTFSPKFISLRPGEDTTANIKGALSLIAESGYQIDTVKVDSFAVISRIKSRDPK